MTLMQCGVCNVVSFTTINIFLSAVNKDQGHKVCRITETTFVSSCLSFYLLHDFPLI
jgi:hypothetical protein